MSKITHEELIEIFNRVLNSCSFVINIPPFGKIETQSYKDISPMSSYYEDKQFEIEMHLNVFENIPHNKIYKVMEDFIHIIEEYVRSKQFKKDNSKKIQNETYRIRKKDINIIKQYQNMIFHYTEDYEYNSDEDFSIVVPVLDSIYQVNKILLKELETGNYKILDVYKYGGVKIYDSSKRPLKAFFNQLKNEYNIKAHSAKEMIDIL